MRNRLITILALYIFIFLSFSLYNAGSVSAQSGLVSLTASCNGGTPKVTASWDLQTALNVGNNCNVYLDEGQPQGRNISSSCKEVDYNVGSASVECGTYILCVQRDSDGFRDCSGRVQIPKCSVGGAANSCSPPAATIPPIGSNTVDAAFGRIEPPAFIKNIGEGKVGINAILNVVVILIYVIAANVFVFMILWSAFQWITSGGEKEKLTAARQRLTHAIIGIVILALAGVIITTIGKIVGFTFFF